jgi:hypothetical protein
MKTPTTPERENGFPTREQLFKRLDQIKEYGYPRPSDHDKFIFKHGFESGYDWVEEQTLSLTTELTSLRSEVERLNGELSEANKVIEGMKWISVDGDKEFTGILIRFEGNLVEVNNPTDILDVEFGNSLAVRFEKQPNGKYMAINAMDGYGNNVKDEVYGKYPMVRYMYSSPLPPAPEVK